MALVVLCLFVVPLSYGCVEASIQPQCFSLSWYLAPSVFTHRYVERQVLISPTKPHQFDRSCTHSCNPNHPLLPSTHPDCLRVTLFACVTLRLVTLRCVPPRVSLALLQHSSLSQSDSQPLA